MGRILIAASAVERAGNVGAAAEAAGYETAASLDCVEPSEFDALILPGGDDVEPLFYGETIRGSTDVNPEIDRKQFALLACFMAASKPVLGICRGLQLLNVWFGGTLIQDLPIDLRLVHSRDAAGCLRIHSTRIAEGSVLTSLFGTELDVTSAHHQGIARLGKGLTAIQWSCDGVIEGIVHNSCPILGVQWHPERMSDLQTMGRLLKIVLNK
ncbi:MAG: gamma-glutamyl-gamma-aminobutyrate hydrolase family protein [Oscillospiraceae bacterium]|jgi:putative glutamine amidotransferase|nr:gamma-glutamyl-gamma-aminobutyrate hydrolase family protein [Oscillospiraceae bacterium]